MGRVRDDMGLGLYARGDDVGAGASAWRVRATYRERYARDLRDGQALHWAGDEVTGDAVHVAVSRLIAEVCSVSRIETLQSIPYLLSRALQRQHRARVFVIGKA